MDEAYFIRPGEGERIRRHRVLAELPQIEALELSFPADFEGDRAGPGAFLSAPQNVVHGFRPCGVDTRLLNFHTPNAGFIGRLRSG